MQQSLTPLTALAKIGTINLDQVKRYMHERMGYDNETLDAMEPEYKRFLALCFASATPKKPAVMSNVVDPMWHTHILYTRDYTGMCRLFGHEHLHHEPALPHELAVLEGDYNRTLDLYTKNFGSPNPRFWPAFAQICTGSSCACSGPGNEIH